MEDVIKEVFEKWEPWILKWRYKLNIPDYEKDDFIQDVKEKLIHAAMLYDDDREASFSSWSYRVLRNYFYNRKRDQKNTNLNFEKDNSYELYDLLEKKDIEENVLARLSLVAKKVASIMWERENEHSEDFYIALRSTKKRKLSMEKELRDFYSLSRNNMKKIYNEIKNVVGEVTNE